MLKRFLYALTLMISCALGVPLYAADTTSTGLKMLSVSPPNALGTYDGVATFGGAMPTADKLDALRSLGLQVQGFRNLPLAMLRGPKQALFDAVSRGIAADVYPNEQLRYFSTASDLSIHANEVHAIGINGAGITVAVVDSGIDARHPDLMNRVVANYKVVEMGAPLPNLVVAMDQGPFNNSDTSSGHGTHVAGIIAADNTDGQVLGVAPGAKLVGYGNGDAIFVFGVLWAYDDLISRGDVRVVNNSWGSSFRLFNPEEPINQATLAAYGAGVTVVFAAGNSSTEMSLNPYSAAPWVISVGNGTLNHQRNATSSGGIEFDNSFLTLLPATDEKHLLFSGDRIGLYHPTVSAPGTNIVSTGTTGVAVTSLPGGTASASGTSMASPHIAGVVALMLQKNPKLTPAEIKSALQVTSDLMPSTADVSKVEAFYRVGYGFVNAKTAVDLVGRQRYNKEKALARLQSTADQRVLGDRDYSVVATDYWAFTAALATVNGTPDTRTYTLQVGPTTKAIKALVSYPSLGYVGSNPFNYQLTLVDAAGKTVGVSAPASNAGMSQFFVDLSQGTYAYGTWTLTVYGEQGAQDQDTLMGTLVSVAVHQLAPQTRVAAKLPVFTASGTQSFYFRPGAAGGVTSPEGCDLQAGAPVGGLATTKGTAACQSGLIGYAVNYGADIPASFTSEPLAAPLTVGGPTTLKFYIVDPAQPVWVSAQTPRLSIEIDAIDANGDLVLAVGANEWTICTTVNGTKTCQAAPQPVGGTYTLNLPGVTLPAGTRLSALVRLAQVVTSTARTVYGGRALTADYSDAGLTFTTGTLQ